MAVLVVENPKHAEFEEYLLDKEIVAIWIDDKKKENRSTDNRESFLDDLKSGTIPVFFRGKFVAYRDGVICGQSRNGWELYQKAEEHYGKANPVKVFKVPKNGIYSIDEILERK